jgi:hypothetical protein
MWTLRAAAARVVARGQRPAPRRLGSTEAHGHDAHGHGHGHDAHAHGHGHGHGEAGPNGFLFNNAVRSDRGRSPAGGARTRAHTRRCAYAHSRAMQRRARAGSCRIMSACLAALCWRRSASRTSLTQGASVAAHVGKVACRADAAHVSHRPFTAFRRGRPRRPRSGSRQLAPSFERCAVLG